MSQQSFPVDQIHANPWQPRTAFDGAAVAELAEDIKARGLLQVPIARVNGNGPELAFGHRRLAAWRIAFPGEPFPLEIRELTDRDMSDLAAAENAQRRDLTAIETARAIQRRIVDFKLTQLEAAKPFGLTSQGGVSNLLRLLKLPAPIQDMVQQHKLAERNARALGVVERLDPALVVPVAEKSMSADNPEEFIDQEIAELLEKKGRDLKDVPWKLNWPKAPLKLERPAGELTEVPACEGCPYLFRHKRNLHYNWSDVLCGRAECYEAKLGLAVVKEIARVAGEKKIAAAAADEKVSLVFDGTDTAWDRQERIKKLVKAHPDELRIVPVGPKERDHNEYQRREILGSEWVALATTNKSLTESRLEAKNAAERAEIDEEVKGEESAAARKKRVEREEREQQERREERAAFHKEKHDSLWLLEHTAPIVAEQIRIEGPDFLCFVADEMDKGRSVSNEYFGEMNAHDEQLREQIEAAARNRDEQLQLIKERMVYGVLINAVAGGYGGKPETVYHFGKICEEVEQICTGKYDDEGDEVFGVKLPADWKKPPVHRTAFNCWQCGRFGSHEGNLTKRELAEGWIDSRDDGSEERFVGVFCSQEHRAEYGREHAKSQGATKAKAARAPKKARKSKKKKSKSK